MMTELLGKWRLDPADYKSREIYGDFSMEFNVAGKLIYTIDLGYKKQIALLTYEIKDNLIITDQPSSPKKEITELSP